MNVTIKTWTKVLALSLSALLFTACTSGGNKSDTTPDSFTLISSCNKAAADFEQICEASTTIKGINKPVAISITGGEYKIDEAGTYTSAKGEVKSGDIVYVRVTASTVELTASTATLKVGIVSSKFTVTTKADDVPPEVTVGTPPTIEEITGDTITLTGSASDPQSGVASVNVKVGQNDPLPATINDDSTWSIELPVSIGDNSIVVTVTDTKGIETVSEAITVTKADDAPPVLVVTSHADSASVTGDNITLSGTVVDEHSTVASVSVAINGGDAVAATIEAGNWTAAGLPINIGANTVTLLATDSLGNSSEAQTLTLTKADNIKPTVAIGTPADAAVLTTETTQVTGTASDEHSSLAAIILTAKANDAEAVVISAENIALNPDGTWTATGVPVAIGSNVITATSTDASNNTSEPASITVNKADTIAPVIAISSHTDGQAVIGETITVSGTATDEHSSIASISLSANATAIAEESITLNSDGSWSVASVPVTIGSNTITVTATDSAGNSSQSASIALNKADDQAPTVDIKFPPPVSMTEDAVVLIRADAQDEHSGVASVKATVTNGGSETEFDLTADEYGTWSPQVGVVDGVNTVEVIVTDAEENQSELASVSVKKDLITNAFPEGNDVFDGPFGMAVDYENMKVYVADVFGEGVNAIDLNSGAAEVFSDNTTQADPAFPRIAQVLLHGGKLYAVSYNDESIFELDLETRQRSVLINETLSPGIDVPKHMVFGFNDQIFVAERERIYILDPVSKAITEFSDDKAGIPNDDVPLRSVNYLYFDEATERMFVVSGLEIVEVASDGSRLVLFGDDELRRMDGFVPSGDTNTFILSSYTEDKPLLSINIDENSYSLVTVESSPSSNGNALIQPASVGGVVQLDYVLVTDITLNGVIAVDKKSGWRVVLSKTND